DVNLEVRKGETVGIIGTNGSGKSTLLKIITGILTPTSGTVEVKGKVAALLELGAGFNPEMTGIENVYFNGTLMGYSREEMDARLDDILSFADIGEFVYQPVKTYSSGMFVRLAFAVSTSVQPEILVVDEALSVGDMYFQQKCVRKMQKFVDSGGTIVFVSHDPNAIKVLCSRVTLLDKGSVIALGEADTVVNLYNRIISDKQAIANTRNVEKEVTAKNTLPFAEKKSLVGYGNLKIEIVDVVLLDSDGNAAGFFTPGEHMKVNVRIHANEAVDDVAVGVLVRDRFGQDIFGINSDNLGKNIAVSRNETAFFTIDLRLNLGVGKYTLTVAAHRGAVHVEENYHWCDAVHSFEIVSGPTRF